MSSIQNRPLWNLTNLNSPFRIAILACLVAIMSYLAAKLGTTVVIRDTLEWPLWPGNILLVSTLLYIPRRIWPIVIGAALGAFALYDLRLGISIRSIIFYQLSDIAEVLIAALGLSYCFAGVPQLDSVKALAKYSLFAVLLAPLAGAFLSAPTTHGGYWRGWRIIFLSQALGYLTLIPAILRWVSKRSEWAHASLSRYLEAAVLLAGLIVLGYFSLVSSSTIIVPVLIIVPFLLWSALRFGTAGVSSVAIAVAFLAIWGAVQGRGPFVGQESASNVPSIQVFLLFVAAPFMVLAVVVEEQTQSQLALRQSEDKLRLLLDSTGEGIYGIDLEERCTFCNPACLRALGYEGIDELLGKNMHDLIHYARADGTLYPVEECRNFRAVRRGEGIHVDDEVLWRADGTSFPVELWSYPQRRGQEVVGAVVTFIDITERKLAEDALASAEQQRERLRQLEADLRLEARVAERTRIARELHDTLLQSFQGVLLKLHAVISMIPNRPNEAQKTLDTLIDQAQQAVIEGRDAVQGLRSSTAVTNDLAQAIRILGAELADQSDSNRADFGVRVEGAPRDLVPILRDDVYRIACEAVRNAFQHAQAARIEVEIRYDPRQLCLCIRDDGKGVDPEVLESGARVGHYGLPGLQERAKLVGGQLSVRSEPGSGTEIELTLPASVVYASGAVQSLLRKSAS